MVYLDLASNLGSKPQRLGVTNCKSSTSDKLQTFRTIFGISCKFLTKTYLHKITLKVKKWQNSGQVVVECLLTFSFLWKIKIMNLIKYVQSSNLTTKLGSS